MNAMKNTKYCGEMKFTRWKTESCFSIKSQGCPLWKDSTKTNERRQLSDKDLEENMPCRKSIRYKYLKPRKKAYMLQQHSQEIKIECSREIDRS